MSIVTIVGEKNEISVERLQRLVARLYFPPPLGGWGVYRYNTLNQVVARQSPDGGLSEFWYDRLGRLVISRNARQKGASATEENRLYSYTKYDSIGRITEVGQVSNTSANGAMTDDISRDPVLLDTWLATLDNRRGQITNTVYDLPYPGFDGVGDSRLIVEQKNLRNRVSYTTITDTGTSNVYSQGTFYTYDILGNVDHLLQDYGSSSYSSSANVMNKNENRWKKISYQYDLISGKVNMVMYLPSTGRSNSRTLQLLPAVTNALHIRGSVIINWVKQHNMRQTQYMAGHKHISSTEAYQLQVIDSLLDGLSKHHPFGK